MRVAAGRFPALGKIGTNGSRSRLKLELEDSSRVALPPRHLILHLEQRQQNGTHHRLARCRHGAHDQSSMVLLPPVGRAYSTRPVRSE